MKYEAAERLLEQVSTLVGELANDQMGIRKLAMVQLSMLGSKAVPVLGAMLVENVEKLKEAVFPYAVEASPRKSVIEGITKVMGTISDPAAVPYLAKALPRLEAVEALAKIGNSEALSLVIKTIPLWYPLSQKKGGPDGQAKEKFAVGVFSYFGPEGVSAIADSLDGSNKQILTVACEIFNEISDESVVPPLLKCLQLGDTEIKARALGVLQKLRAKIPKNQLMDELEFAYSENMPEFSTYSWMKLQEGLIQAADTEVLVEFLLNRSWKLRSSFPKDLLEYYISLDGSRAMPTLLKSLEGGTQSQQEIAAAVIAKIKTPEKKRPDRQYY